MENMNGESWEPIFAEPIKQFSTKRMTEFFKHPDSAMRIIEENDPNATRSGKVAREIQNSSACYKELYRETKNAARHLSLDCFNKKKFKIISLSSQGLQESDDPD
jgi:hypothetical protein